jgi:hypothetical protein
MKCKNCETKDAVKYSEYSTGEFCCIKCARGFSTKEKRNEINNKVSLKLKGSGHGNIEKKCPTCNTKFLVAWTNRKQIHCSSKCVISRNGRLKTTITLEKKCKGCNKTFFVIDNKNTRRQIFCGKSCAAKHNGRIGGLKSSTSQSRRSKNEIYFGELCEKKFNKVLFNEPMFNGWDADVIIEELKLAISWNGKWHYEKIAEKHSVEQVQNRDKIREKEIIKSGYKHYVVKDMCKFNEEFVKKEFDKLLTIYL